MADPYVYRPRSDSIAARTLAYLRQNADTALTSDAVSKLCQIEVKQVSSALATAVKHRHLVLDNPGGDRLVYRLGPVAAEVSAPPALVWPFKKTEQPAEPAADELPVVQRTVQASEAPALQVDAPNSVFNQAKWVTRLTDEQLSAQRAAMGFPPVLYTGHARWSEPAASVAYPMTGAANEPPVRSLVAVPKVPTPAPSSLTCGLFNNGELIITNAGGEVTLNREEARGLVDYLELIGDAITGRTQAQQAAA